MVLIIVSFVIAALMGMGVGGGGLFIIYLTQWSKFDQMSAQGTNLIFFILAGIAALIYHFGKRRIYPMQVLVMASLGMLGSYLLSHLANAIDPHIPKILLGVFLTVTGVYTFISAFIKKKK